MPWYRDVPMVGFDLCRGTGRLAGTKRRLICGVDSESRDAELDEVTATAGEMQGPCHDHRHGVISAGHHRYPRGAIIPVVESEGWAALVPK